MVLFIAKPIHSLLLIFWLRLPYFQGTPMFNDSLLQCLRNAHHMVILTGAGVSAESGIPTFRDAMTGLWARYDPQQLASERGFCADPALVWGWYEWRRSKVAESSPNPAHRAIAQLQTQVPKLTLITQNVDDLHERGGSQSVIHLHGNLQAAHCIACTQPFALTTPVDRSETKRVEPPRCPACGNYIRPGVVWFGESLPLEQWHDAEAAAQQCDVLLSIGTSALAYPAANLPGIALKAGAKLIQINPEPTSLDAKAHFNLHGKAGALLPTLLQAVYSQSFDR
jgi:NAD-dependent deacetylase